MDLPILCKNYAWIYLFYARTMHGFTFLYKNYAWIYLLFEKHAWINFFINF